VPAGMAVRTLPIITSQSTGRAGWLHLTMASPPSPEFVSFLAHVHIQSSHPQDVVAYPQELRRLIADRLTGGVCGRLGRGR
jgi:hypothetical protein